MKSGTPMRTAVLLPLTAAVLAAHVWLLQPPPLRARMGASARAPALATRRIESPPAPISVPSPAPSRAVPAMRPSPPQLRLPAAAPAHEVARDHEARDASAPAAEVTRVDVPSAGDVRYEVTGWVNNRPVQGSSELKWQHDGARYSATFEVSVPGLPSRRQNSEGQVTPAGLEPQRFGEQLRSEQATHFDRTAGRVTFSNNRPSVPLLAGAQDRLTVLLQLAAMLAGDPRLTAPGATIAIQTATTREAEPWLFTVEGEDTLQFSVGDVTTVKLVRPPHGEHDPRMEVWMAPGKAYAPVRLRLTQPNGDWTDHQWSTTDRR
jgi:hypothetical protein